MTIKQAYLQGFISQMHKRGAMPMTPLARRMPPLGMHNKFTMPPLGMHNKFTMPPKPSVPAPVKPPVVPGNPQTGAQPLPPAVMPPSM